MSLLRTCSFVRANGIVCRSLAPKDATLCRTHQEDANRLANFRDAVTSRRCEMAQYAIGYTTICKVPGVAETFDDVSAGLFHSLNLPPVEDANSLQVSLNAVLRGLAHQLIPPRTAALMLYGLQISSSNLRRTRQPIPPLDTVSTDAPPPLRSIKE